MENNQEKLIYIKGFLDGIALLNSFDNDGKTYSIDLFEKINNDCQATLREHLNLRDWTFQTELIEDWRIILKTELRPYFDQIIFEVLAKAHKDLNKENGPRKATVEEEIFRIRNSNCFYIDILIGIFIQNISSILDDRNYQIYKVKLEGKGWYEAYYNDYLFDLGDQILFIHFGGSD